VAEFEGQGGGRTAPRPTDIAWAAGLFEGEGFMSVYQRQFGAKVQPQIGLGMTDRDVVERFVAIVGCGSISVVKPGTGGHKPVHCWRLYEAVEVRRVVAMFLPLFGERRTARALALLEQIKDVQPHFSRKSHCPRGHEYVGDNLQLEEIQRNGRTYFSRRCRTCRTDQERTRKARARATA
jgi:hypothetical protein